jgi:hypothetical protein
LPGLLLTDSRAGGNFKVNIAIYSCFFLLPTYFDHQKKTDSVNNYQLFNWKNKLNFNLMVLIYKRHSPRHNSPNQQFVGEFKIQNWQADLAPENRH